MTDPACPSEWMLDVMRGFLTIVDVASRTDRGRATVEAWMTHIGNQLVREELTS